LRPALLAFSLVVAACAAAPDIIASQPGPVSPAELGTFAFRSSEAVTDFIVTYRLAVFVHENPRDAYAAVRDPGSLIGNETAPDPAGSEGLTRESTLVLMALAGPDEKAIWQATASGVATTREELSAGALRTVEAMLERFPTRGHATAGPGDR